MRIETLFALGQSGNILTDENGDPVYDDNFFSMLDDWFGYVYRTFPLFD